MEFIILVSQMEQDITDGAELGDTLKGIYTHLYVDDFPLFKKGCLVALRASASVSLWYLAEGGLDDNDFGGILAPAVYGKVLCAVDARGDLRLKFQRAGGNNRFNGTGYIAGGIGKCEPGSWGAWEERWWNDKWCAQGGAMLDVTYDEGEGWDMSADADRERLKK